MSEKKIIQFDLASQVNSDAYVPITQLVNGNQKTLKASIASLTEKIVGKVITGTLTAYSTSITLSDASISPSSTIDVYTDGDVDYNSISVSTGSVTITFDAQETNLGVKVRIS